MKINFTRLIAESGEKLTKAQLAREMTEAELFGSQTSGELMIQRLQNGKAKSVKWDVIKWLVKRFNRPGAEIITWDN